MINAEEKTGLIIGIPKLAEYLNCSINRIYRYMELGMIPGDKIDGSWHFYKHNVEEFWQKRLRHVKPIEGEEIGSPEDGEIQV